MNDRILIGVLLGNNKKFKYYGIIFKMLTSIRNTLEHFVFINFIF